MSLKGFVKGIGDSIEKGAKSAWGYITGDNEHPNGGIYVSGSTSTDMGYNLEGKNTALTMGEMAPGEYTEMYGNTTAYNEEENKKDNGTFYDVLGAIGTGVATSYINNYYNRKMQREQNDWNANQAALDREWQEHMANTAHQREMADLLATGLNPVNTATGGGGAATPGGANASGTTPPYMDAGQIGNTALSLAETLKALNENKYISKEKKTQIANTVADTAKKEAETGLTQKTTDKTQAEKENLEETKKLIQENVRQAKKNNDFNDIINVSDNTPQGYRYMRTMLWSAGVTELNENNESAVEQTKDFMDWAEKNGITTILPGQDLKTLWNIYKSSKK